MNRPALLGALCLVAACADSTGPGGGFVVETVDSDGRLLGVPALYWYLPETRAAAHLGECAESLCSRWTFADEPAGDVVIGTAWLGLHPEITGCEWGGQGAMPVRHDRGESRVVRLRVEIVYLCAMPARPPSGSP